MQSSILCLMQNRNSFIMINDAHPEKQDYQKQGFSEVERGSRKHIENVIEEVWDNLDTPDDERIYLKVV